MIITGNQQALPPEVWEMLVANAPIDVVKEARHDAVLFIVELDDDGDLVAFAAGEAMMHYYIMAGIWCFGDYLDPDFMHEGMRQMKLSVATLTIESEEDIFTTVGFKHKGRLYCSNENIPMETAAGVTSMDMVPLCDWAKYEMLFAMDLEIHQPTESGRGYEKPMMEVFGRIKKNPELAIVKIVDGHIVGIMLLQQSEMNPDQNYPLLQTELFVMVTLLAINNDSYVPDELLHYAAVKLESQNKRIVVQSERSDGEEYLRDTLRFQYIYSTVQYIADQVNDDIEPSPHAMDDPSTAHR